MSQFLKLIFHISILLLIIISVFPGSLVGLILYGDLEHQPELIKNSLNISFNHFIAYLYVSLSGFLAYSKNKNLKNLILGLFFLSIILESLHIIIPNRAFELSDIIGNILGVLVAYLVLKIYLLFR